MSPILNHFDIISFDPPIFVPIFGLSIKISPFPRKMNVLIFQKCLHRMTQIKVSKSHVYVYNRVGIICVNNVLLIILYRA